MSFSSQLCKTFVVASLSEPVGTKNERKKVGRRSRWSSFLLAHSALSVVSPPLARSTFLNLSLDSYNHGQDQSQEEQGHRARHEADRSFQNSHLLNLLAHRSLLVIQAKAAKKAKNEKKVRSGLLLTPLVQGGVLICFRSPLSVLVASLRLLRRM